MKILIQGGGIGGLALASFLKDKGIESVIIEQAPEFRNIGYGLAINPTGRRMLRYLNMEQRLDAEGCAIDGYELTDTQRKPYVTIDYRPLSQQYGPIVTIMRSAVHSMTIDAARKRGIPMEMNDTIYDIQESDRGVSVRLRSGKTLSGDLLVGADGIHSQIREAVFDRKDVTYYGFSSWMFWLPQGFEYATDRVVHMDGNCAYIGIYPYGSQRCALYLTKKQAPRTPDPVIFRKQRIQKDFAEFGWIIPAALEAIESPEKIFHDEVMKMRLDEWHKGRVVLIGDAAHGLSPMTGFGASMALEDAYVLAEELARGTATDALRSVARYGQRRMNRIRAVKKFSRYSWNLLNRSEPYCFTKAKIWLYSRLPNAWLTKDLAAIFAQEP